MEKIKIGIIGGSGVYELSNAEVIEEIEINTPFGKPSDNITIAQIGDKKAAFLPRHGKGHRLIPSEVNSKANIYALKTLGVTSIIGISAVGSLKEEIRPTDIVLPSQLIDRTKGRPLSYFGQGVVGHISFADPFCGRLRAGIKAVIENYIKDNNSGKRLFTEETYICMEGPQFSTRAESNLYRSWEAGVIGMTALPETKLAREAEICYAAIALPTDYDCWREGEEAVDVSIILENMKENNNTVNQLIPLVIENITTDDGCSCGSAVKYAIMTKKELIPYEIRRDLDLFYGKYWK